MREVVPVFLIKNVSEQYLIEKTGCRISDFIGIVKKKLKKYLPRSVLQAIKTFFTHGNTE